MGTFFAYSIQSALCLILFYIFYKVLLSRETFFRFNRFALLSILVFSLAIPVCGIFFAHIGTATTTQLVSENTTAGNIIATPKTIAVTETPKSEIIFSILLLIYFIGCIEALILSEIRAIHILHLIHGGKCRDIGDGVKLVIHPSNKVSPFSWMHYIVMSEADFGEDGSDIIITHEKSHIHLHHSRDLIVGQLCLILQWFNPAAWLLYQELQTVHEYEADEDVLRHGIDARNYQLLLIKKAVGTRLYSMANNLNHSNLKKRITMMLKRKSNSWARLKYAYVLPLAVTTVAAFANPEISQKFDKISSVKITNFVAKTSTNDVKNLTEIDETALARTKTETEHFEVAPPDTTIYNFKTIDELPEFPGGQEALLKWVGENLTYPDSTIQGRTFCTFIVRKDGSITDITIVKSSGHKILDDEALRALSTLPKFKPGKMNGVPVDVKYSLPINFSKKKK